MQIAKRRKMLLRNKKTGEVFESFKRGPIDLYFYPNEHKVGDDIERETYQSLAELNADWEDYKPKEPLIKDEKIRKAVRAWADSNEIVKAFVVMDKNMNWIVYGDDIDRNRFMIEFFDRVVSENDETNNYTIDELCGDEE